ncbi:MAG: NirA family protein [Planctomycetota bacterium]
MCGQAKQPADYQGFTPEQQQYLANLLSQLDLSAVFSAGSPAPGSQPQEVTIYGTPFEDLCKEEVAKHETHPGKLWPKMRALAESKRMPEGIDTFMIKHHGMFNVAPAQAGYMCRMRIPACKLRGDQLAGLADLAENLAGGYAHVTTRGNLQVREIAPENLIKNLEALYDLGLTSKGSGADSVRNITASPSAGFDVDELIDLSPHAIALHHHILNDPDLHGIPRKFNISFDNGGRLSCVSDTNDIMLLATELREATQSDTGLEPGVYCRLGLGGITGHLDFARDAGVLIRPEHTVDACVAMLQVFVEHGDRTNRKKARLKYVLDQHGFDWYLEKSQEKLTAINPDAKFYAVPAKACAPRNEIDRQGHCGVQDQKQPGLKYVGVNLPVGKLKPDQMRGLGRIAQQYGRNDIRLTVWQNLLLPYIAEADMPSVLDELKELGLTTEHSAFAAGAVACTGRMGCKYAAAHTKSHAGMLVEHLEGVFGDAMDQPLNLHLTGCAHSCAQHYIGDIGLLGASTDDGREAYQVFLGGGSDLEQGIARHLVGPVPADEISSFLEHIVRTYLDQREPNERFVHFTRRHSEDQLRELFLPAGVAA